MSRVAIVSPTKTEPAGGHRAGLFTALLRHWRTRRGLSQLDLAIAADVSSRHISFIETGRSTPSAEMVIRLAACLDVPLRHVNAMLRAAGHPPWYAEPSGVEPLPPGVRSALDLMKQHHEPFPLVVLDRGYRLVDANQGAVAVLAASMQGIGEVALSGLNLAKFTVDPELGGRIVINHEAVVGDLVGRIQRELLTDPHNDALRALLDDLLESPGPAREWRKTDPTAPSAPTLDLQLRVGDETWSFLLVVSALLAPLEVILEELRIEQWFPADDVTAAGCAALASQA